MPEPAELARQLAAANELLEGEARALPPKVIPVASSAPSSCA